MHTRNRPLPGSHSNATTRRSRVLSALAGAAVVFMLAACGGGGGAGGAADTAAATEVALHRDGQAAESRRLDDSLKDVLKRHAFTGKIESTLEPRLGRKLDAKLADLGNKLFFDTILGLHDDNTCAGCHSPAAGMGDTQSIAIGVDSNRIVGPSRTGPRNQRRAPSVVNTPFYPKLMWNGRFYSPADDPFSNAQGFEFTLPEGITAFPPNHPTIKHLLVAQAFIPPTELVEAAGFTGITDLGERFLQFNDGHGSAVPAAVDGFRNEPIRQAVLQRLNASFAYRALFGARFPEVAAGAPIDFSMVGRAIAEFEFTLVRANAPLDRYARGERDAMSEREKRGALVFFGKGNCVACHAVKGIANEMFSDFEMHNIGVPQIAPPFGVGRSNMVYDGPGENEDYGLAQITGGIAADRYKFRSSPLRNAALQPAFFHNGAFTRLEDAIRHHLDAAQSTRHYDPRRAGIDRDLRNRLGPIEPVLATLDPLLSTPIELKEREFEDLVAFVRDGLLDPKARPNNLCRVIPTAVPSGRALLTFQGC